MSQTRLRSGIEAASMTFIGIAYAIPLNYFFINVVKWSSPWAQAIGMCLIFTVMSFTQKYIGRRIFNWWDTAHPPDRVDLPEVRVPDISEMSREELQESCPRYFYKH